MPGKPGEEFRLSASLRVIVVLRPISTRRISAVGLNPTSVSNVVSA